MWCDDVYITLFLKHMVIHWDVHGVFVGARFVELFLPSFTDTPVLTSIFLLLKSLIVYSLNFSSKLDNNFLPTYIPVRASM